MLSRLKNIFSDYTNIIKFLLIVTTFSGALRKWVGLPSIINNLLLLIIMALPIYIILLFKNQTTIQLNNSLKNITYLFIFILLILAVHPLNLTFLHGVFGFFVHFIFIAILLSYQKNTLSFKGENLIRLFFYILVIQLVVATIQYSSPAESFINRYADNRQEQANNNDEDFIYATATVGDAIRVTGTFSYLGGYTAIVFFFLFITFYLTKTRNSSYIFWLSPIIIYAALLSGSRGCVGFILILLFTFILTERSLIIKNPKPFFLSLGILLTFIGINFALNDFLGIINKTTNAYENFMLRVDNNRKESEGRLTSDIVDIFTRDFEYRYTGVGLGSTYQGANALFGTSDIVKQTPVEGEAFRLLVEGGIFFVFLRWLYLIIIFSYLKIPSFFKIICFLFMCVFSQNVFHIYNATYFAIGLMMLDSAYRKENLS